MLARLSVLFLAAAAAIVIGPLSGCAYAGDAPAKLRVCVADFRPEKGTALSERELDYCKMVQRGVEDKLVEWYEVEESTRYGTIAKQLANVDAEQAAAVLAEKAGVHQVVTGLVTRVGSTVIVQCHFVEVPRAGQSGQEAKNRVVRSVNADCKIVQEDDWLLLMKTLQVKIYGSMTGTEVTPPVPPTPPPTVELVKITVCKLSGKLAGPNCKEIEIKQVKPTETPGPCTDCKPAAPQLTPEEIPLRIAQVLRAIDDGKYGEGLKVIDDVVKAAADNGEAWYIKGVILYHQDKLEDAEKCFLKAVQLGYDRASVRDDLANTYYKLAYRHPGSTQKFYDSAVEQSRKALELAPGDPWAYNMIGCVSFVRASSKDRAKLREAVDSLLKAAELLTSDPQLLDNAANGLAQLDDLAQAERYAKSAVAAAEKNNEPYANAYETLSKIYSVKGDKQNARKYHELYRKSVGRR